MVQAVLLAAGHGRRLTPLTEARPKGMLLVGGKPLLQHAVEALREEGIHDVVMVVGRHGEKIQSFFKDGADFGVSVRYAYQSEATGSTDALRAALPLLEPDGPVWVLGVSVFVTPTMLAPLSRGKGAVLLVAEAGDVHPQAVPDVRGDRLVGMREETPVRGSTRVATGLMRLDQDALQAVAASHGPELDLSIGQHAASGGSIQIVHAPGPWQRLIEPWDLLRINERVLDGLPRQRTAARGPRITGAVRIGDKVTIAPSATLVGPLTIGDGSTIGDYTVVGPYVSLRNNTVVGSHCEVRRSILNNNVFLDSQSIVRGCILDDGVRVGPGFVGHEESTPQGPVGCILGHDAALGAGVRAHGGAVLPPEVAVEAGGLLR